MLDGLATLLEKLPTFAAKSGLILAMVGGALQLGLRFGLVEAGALNGYVAQGAPVLTLTGGAMVAAAVTATILAWIASWRWTFVAWRRRRGERRQLLENIGFLDADARLMLLVITDMPSGRVPDSDDRTIERMKALKLLEQDQPGSWVLGRAGTLRLAPVLFKRRAWLQANLIGPLSAHFDADVRSRDVQAELIEQRRRREQALGMF